MKLYGYQEQAVQFAIDNHYCILALDVGLGKTFVSLTVGARTKSKMLVLAPAYLKLNWAAEIKKTYPELSYNIIKSKKDIQKAKSISENIVILSHNLLEGSDSLFEWADTVIVDEVHNFKSLKTKRTDSLHRLVYENSVKRLILLTGTPILNRVWEFYSPITLCQYKPLIKNSPFLEKYSNYVDFADQFSYRNEFEMQSKNKWRTIKIVQWNGYRNVDELKSYLKGIYLRIKAENVLKDLPKKIYKDVLINDVEDKELLETFNLAQMSEDMDKVRPDIKAKAALDKTPFTVAYVQDLLEAGKKVLIYSDHREAAHAIAKAFKTAAITGEMPTHKRHQLAETFQKGDSQILVATIGSFSTGVTLTACHNTVFNDLPWRPGDIIQAEGRTARIGQTHPCVYHRIFGSITDQHISKKLSEKQETIQKVT